MRTLNQLKKDFIFSLLTTNESGVRHGKGLPHFDDDHPAAFKLFLGRVSYSIENHENPSAEGAHEYFLKRMAEDGWSYGTKMDIPAKTHPAMLPWNDLHEDYQKEYFDTGFAIFEACAFFDELVKYIKKSITS